MLAGLVVSDYLGHLTLDAFDLRRIVSGPTAITTKELLWWPTLTSMTSSEDGRVFVSNLNDSAVSIVDSNDR